MFVSFEAQAKGFMAGCRPIIGLDACFLKGPLGGQLMHAVAKDGNNQMWPLAYAVVEVEAESKESWTWFMENLDAIIGNSEEKGWIFISDRQKGLTQTFAQKYPTVEHRYCIRHMYANFCKIYKGKEWKDLMWTAASMYTVQEFEKAMEAIKKADEKAYDWLMREDPKTWARCMYGTRAKCNRMDNNTSEAFNQAIKDVRDQPILTMMETIRRYLMTRIQTRLKLSSGWEGRICPRIVGRIQKTTNLMGECEVIYSGHTLFEVLTVLRTFVVDIGERTCSCRKWDVCGIPCMHGMAAIITDKSDPFDFIDECFHVSSFTKTYSLTIKPIPDQTIWVRTDFDPINPPPLRPRAGRPKKNRRKGQDEKDPSEGVKRFHTTLKCRACKQPCHNTRTCIWSSINTLAAQEQIQSQSGASTTGRGRGRGATSTVGVGRGPAIAAGKGRGAVTTGYLRQTYAHLGVRGGVRIGTVSAKSGAEVGRGQGSSGGVIGGGRGHNNGGVEYLAVRGGVRIGTVSAKSGAEVGRGQGNSGGVVGRGKGSSSGVVTSKGRGGKRGGVGRMRTRSSGASCGSGNDTRSGTDPIQLSQGSHNPSTQKSAT